MEASTGHGSITEEMIARSRSRIGEVWRPTEPYFNMAATKDTIRHFVNGIGDLNPLFRDQDYAKKTKYGRMVAPPCFLYSVYWPSGGGSFMPGIHTWHSGNEWEWFCPILEGDEFTFEVTLKDVVEKKSQMAGRIFIGYDEVTYRNQRGEVDLLTRFAKEHAGKPLVLVLEPRPGALGRHRQRLRSDFLKAGIPTYPSLKRASRSLSKLISYHEFQAGYQ